MLTKCKISYTLDTLGWILANDEIRKNSPIKRQMRIMCKISYTPLYSKMDADKRSNKQISYTLRLLLIKRRA